MRMVAHSVASVVQVSLLSGTKVQNEKSGGVPDCVAGGHCDTAASERIEVASYH